MKTFRVLVAMADSLLAEGLVGRLEKEPGLEVRIVPGEGRELEGELQAFRPQALVLGRDQADALLSVLSAHPGLRVVTLGLESSEVTIYDGRRLTVATVHEVVELLRGRRNRATKRQQRSDSVSRGTVASQGATRIEGR